MSAGVGMHAAKPATNPLQTVADIAGKIASLPTMPVNLLNEGFAAGTNFIAQALPSFPAATIGSLAVGLPHAHLAHPPFFPMLPFGPIILGFSVQVLINGLPAARSGALGLSPTCLGLTGLYEVFTGSSKVFISGERAVRMTDITFHCKPNPSPKLGKACNALGNALRIAGKTVRAAGKVAQAASLGASLVGAARADGKAERNAYLENFGMSLAATVVDAAQQQVQDQIKDAAAKLMGKDPPTPPSGSPGMVVLGSPNVLIGGFPMPSWMAIARGLMRRASGGLESRFMTYLGAFHGTVGCP